MYPHEEMPEPNQKQKGSKKGIIVPCIILAVILFTGGLVFYWWSQKEEAPKDVQQQGAETQSNTGGVTEEQIVAYLDKKVEEVVTVTQESQEELITRIEALEKGTAKPKTADNTPTVHTQPDESKQPEAVVAEPNTTQTVKKQIVETNKQTLGVTSTSQKETAKIKDKKMYVISAEGVNLPTNSTTYVLVLESASGLILPFYTSYTTYSSMEVGTELKVEYLIYGTGENIIYDLFKVEK